MTLTDFINVRSEYAELYANKKEKYTQKEHIEKIDNVSIFFGIVEVILSFSVCCLIILTVLCLLEKPSHVQNVLLLTIVFGILFIILRKLNTKITTYRENTIEKIQKHAIEKAKEKISKKYEVEFYGPDGLEYDYAINAETGEIVASGFDMDDDHYWLSKLQNGTGAGNGGNGNAYGNGNGGQGAGSTAASISEDDAAAIALERVPGATANDLRIHLDHDDGRLVYEGEIVYDRMEYEFKIDALSGSILEWESERWDR